MMKRSLLTLIFALCFLSAGAAYASKVSIDPAHVRVIVLPGESQSGALRVDNPSDQEVKIRVYLEDWRYSSCSDGAKDFFPPGTTSLSCAKWIDFSPAEFTIPPFGRQTINYTVRVPQDAKGAHFSVMFFETDISDTSADNAESGVKLKARLGALFSVEAKDSLVCEASVSGLNLNRESSVLKISGNFKNNGNSDIVPRITFDIIDSKGEVYARGKFSDIFTLPQDECRIEAETKEHLREGNYILVITLNLGRGRPKVMEVPISVGASAISVINS
jgi:hypothetical protein